MLIPVPRHALAETAERQERSRLQAEVASTHAAMRGSLDAMADPFLVAASLRNAEGEIIDFRIDFANRAAVRFISAQPSELAGLSFRRSMGAFGPRFYDDCVRVAQTGLPYAADGLSLPGSHSQPHRERLVDVSMSRFSDGFFLAFRDVTESRRLGHEREFLAAVVEHSTDAIAIADVTGRIVYANHAFESEVGVSIGRLRGRSMPKLMSGALAPATISAIDAAVRAGTGWLGEVPQRLTDGTTRLTLLSVTAGRDPHGVVTSVVTVFRDVSELREAQADADLEMRIRLVLAESLDAIPAGASVAEAAQAICDQLATLPFVDLAAVQAFVGDRGVKVIAQSAPAAYRLPVGTMLPASRASIVREHATVGPWAEDVSDEPAGAWMPAMIESGIKALAIGPIGHLDRVEGVLLIGTLDQEFARTLVEKMPGIISFTTTLSALLAERLHLARREAELREALRAALASRPFHPVYQPIVDMESGDVAGYEALTRFDSGQRPDLCFAEAWSVGLGPEVELATLEAAVGEGRRLPPALWLSLNVSPRLLLQPERILPILRRAERALVIEVTEHEAIDDYDALREAIRLLGRDIRIAVDDAGSGIANFGHIIDLRPDFVKLDISLVRGVNANLGRQAMVVGMRHFSRTAGCRLIAEGVETTEEARTLRSLGVEFGQGYLFGRPQPVPTAY